MALTVQQIIDLQAQFKPIAPGGFSNSISDLLNDKAAALAVGVVSLILQFGAYLFMVAVLVAGTLYLFSFGKEESITRAKNALLYSFLGFTVFVSANAGLNFYIRQLENIAATDLSLSAITGKLFNSILIIAGLGFFVVYAYSGLRYFFTGGNEEAAASTRRGMTYAFIGIIVTTAAYAISTIIIKRVFLIGS